jgi:hypothetical protein
MDTDSHVRHVVVYHDPVRWGAVPANNGANGPVWQWGEELLVGFTVGTFAKAEKGHQCSYDAPFHSWLARSPDGGESWQSWKPEGYAGQPAAARTLNAAIDFTAPGFALRVEGNGYHGNSGCRWFASADKGSSWQGPFDFASLMDHPELTGKEFTGRTAYLVNGPGELILFLSVRRAQDADRLKVAIPEKTFLARTTDGGRSFDFVSWVVPWTEPSRAVMAAPVRLSAASIVAALRRKSQTNNWIDCYHSANNGLHWSHLSRVGDTEVGNNCNGNPPALVAMADSRLCCVYGNRTERKMLARYSADAGRTWGEPVVLRGDFHSANGWPDLGYPRLFQRPDGRLVTAYFWCTRERPQTHIEATVF